MPLYSSLKLGSDTPLDKDSIRKINIILKALLEHNEAYEFKQPVDWKGKLIIHAGMNLTDYPAIVKHPMDLGTVEKNLRNDKYSTV